MTAVTQAPEPSFRMRPGDELTDVLNALGVDGPARDLLCFVAGRDPKTFALAVGFAAPDLLPERLHDTVLDLLTGRLR